MHKYKASAFKNNSGEWSIAPIEVKEKNGKVFYPERVLFKRKYYKLESVKNRAIYKEDTPMIEDNTDNSTSSNNDKIMNVLDLHESHINDLVQANKDMINAVRFLNSKVKELETICKSLSLKH